ncbi:MAG: hypothetical protein FWB71_05480 [Defluviitaleaceae bacterium]|nr:hypothetical protein [Defluviitaleaceae bacterium]
MATDREIKSFEISKLYDLLEVFYAADEQEMREILRRMIFRSESQLSKEEISHAHEQIQKLTKGVNP